MLVNTVGLVLMRTVETINDNCGIQYVFVIPVIAIFASGIFAAIFMPETHGLSLMEIRKLYVDKVSVHISNLTLV